MQSGYAQRGNTIWKKKDGWGTVRREQREFPSDCSFNAGKPERHWLLPPNRANKRLGVLSR